MSSVSNWNPINDQLLLYCLESENHPFHPPFSFTNIKSVSLDSFGFYRRSFRYRSTQKTGADLETFGSSVIESPNWRNTRGTYYTPSFYLSGSAFTGRESTVGVSTITCRSTNKWRSKPDVTPTRVILKRTLPGLCLSYFILCPQWRRK